MKEKRRIGIVDTTLRDGEQSPGIIFSAEDKLHIALSLAKAGVEWIEAGVPIMGPEEQEAMKLILASPITAKLIAWNRAFCQDILSSIACGFSYIHISVPVSDLHIQEKIKKSRAWVLGELAQGISLARSYGCIVSVGAEDASRADLDFFLQVAELAAKMGAIRIRYADTVGCLTPFRVDSIFRQLVPRLPLPIEVHMHNDFGLAGANTLVALAAGAEFASTTVSGIGERAGNAGFEEVVMALHNLYGMDTGIDVKAFRELSDVVMTASQRKVFPYQPVCGQIFLESTI